MRGGGVVGDIVRVYKVYKVYIRVYKVVVRVYEVYVPKVYDSVAYDSVL